MGGGSLSLPLAFHQSGNIFIAPLILILTGALAQQSILFLVRAGVYSNTRSNMIGTADNINHQHNKKGVASYENVASQAFGPSARYLSSALVSACCFFGTVGYAVLLRDMLEPVVDSLVTPPEGIGGGPTLARNVAMWAVVLCVTPLCTLKNLTALKNVGAASMVSVGIVGFCVAYRSIQCQLSSGVNNEGDSGGGNENEETIGEMETVRAFPSSMKELLDAMPLFISAFICHFNVLPIHNELRCPTSDRVKKWTRTSIWPATLFYWVIGLTGSLYAKCTPTGSVQGNILLDFDENDPLLLIGRFCLAMTITFAFPMLVVPARDILVQSLMGSMIGKQFLRSISRKRRFQSPGTLNNDIPSHVPASGTQDGLATIEFEPMEISQVGNLEEPLLVLENRSIASTFQDGFEDADEIISLSSIFQENVSRATQPVSENTNKTARIVCAMIVFWTAVSLACIVESIDVVWDLVGSSFSIMMAFLIPCGAYLKLGKRKRFEETQDGGMGFRRWMLSRAVAWIMLFTFVPLMFVSTANAVYNSFFQ